MIAGKPSVVMVLSNCHAPLGGTQKQALRLARQLHLRGLSVAVVSKQSPTFKPERGGELREFPLEEMDGLRFVGLPTLRREPAWSMLVTLWGWAWRHRKEIDVLHAHNVPLGVIACVVGWALGKKVVVKVPAWEFVEYLRGESPGRRLRRWIVRVRADRLVAVNRDIASALLELGIPPRRVALIPNGIDLATGGPAVDPAGLRRDLLGQGAAGVVLYVGRLVEEKGLDRLLEAWAALADRDRHRLVLVGDGPLREGLEARARALGIEAAVRFAGHQREVAAFYAAADVFVLPSLTEGLSNALLEAMVAGLPVVVSDITGNRQIVDEASGFLVDWGRPRACAALLARLLAEPELRRRAGAAARERVRAFAMPEIAERYHRLYDTVLHE